jgi:hypothetical protein
MSLHVVLHHPRDPHQPWANDWLDDNCIRAITTTAHIGNLCELARKNGDPVLVHRCGYGNAPAVISCSALVQDVNRLPGRGALVRFLEATTRNDTPTTAPVQGQNYY